MKNKYSNRMSNRREYLVEIIAEAVLNDLQQSYSNEEMMHERVSPRIKNALLAGALALGLHPVNAKAPSTFQRSGMPQKERTTVGHEKQRHYTDPSIYSMDTEDVGTSREGHVKPTQHGLFFSLEAVRLHDPEFFNRFILTRTHDWSGILKARGDINIEDVDDLAYDMREYPADYNISGDAISSGQLELTPKDVQVYRSKQDSHYKHESEQSQRSAGERRTTYENERFFSLWAVREHEPAFFEDFKLSRSGDWHSLLASYDPTMSIDDFEKAMKNSPDHFNISKNAIESYKTTLGPLDITINTSAQGLPSYGNSGMPEIKVPREKEFFFYLTGVKKHNPRFFRHFELGGNWNSWKELASSYDPRITNLNQLKRKMKENHMDFKISKTAISSEHMIVNPKDVQID